MKCAPALFGGRIRVVSREILVANVAWNGVIQLNLIAERGSFIDLARFHYGGWSPACRSLKLHERVEVRVGAGTKAPRQIVVGRRPKESRKVQEYLAVIAENQ